MERERVTVQEAARQLGITESAVRKRVQRRLLGYDKEPDGRLYVYLDTQDIGRDEVRDTSYDMLVRRLENENEFLRRELERKDTILLNMTEAMKALNPPAQEAHSEPRESPESPEPSDTPTEGSRSTETPVEHPEGEEVWLDAEGREAQPQEATEASETVEEGPERAEPRSATGGAQEAVQKPQGRSWWRRLIGG